MNIPAAAEMTSERNLIFLQTCIRILHVSTLSHFSAPQSNHALTNYWITGLQQQHARNPIMLISSNTTFTYHPQSTWPAAIASGKHLELVSSLHTQRVTLNDSTTTPLSTHDPPP
eukprot:scpid85173/ scgid7152/ 